MVDNLNELYTLDKSKRGTVVYNGEYNGYKYEIKTICTHPTAYVYLKDSVDKYIRCCNPYNVDAYTFDYIDVHGGITFYEGGKIGWDYAHYNDYIHDKIHSRYDNTYIWTYEDIMIEIKHVIDQLEVEVKNYDTNNDCVQEFKNAVMQAINHASKNLPHDVDISNIIKEISNKY